MYVCVSGTKVCFEQHNRLWDNLQRLSAKECTTATQPERLTRATEMRYYCQYEKDGPDYTIVYDFANNTVKYELKASHR